MSRTVLRRVPEALPETMPVNLLPGKTGRLAVARLV
jgi:hypothetical protein